MSIIETYSYSDTNNELVNVSILRQQILDDATPIPNLESVAALDGSSEILIQFASALSGAEKTALDAVVADHDGVEFAPREQSFESLAIQDTSVDNPKTVLNVSAGPTIPNLYVAILYCEIRLQSTVVGGIATVAFKIDGVEVATTTHLDTGDWTSFSASVDELCKAGDVAAMQVTLTQSGVASVAEIRRVHLDFNIKD
jgi:hypothetical protein